MMTAFKQGGNWVVRDDDPRVKDLFGTDVLPMPYRDTKPADFIRRVLEELNPGKDVVVQS